ncbi:AI-2E family transporter [Celerinatantimonas sp. YJH-8]|uniref:AI-2E family transporter n=1 Tax=Celerinatantimonas sp. YJH-8 TaxID=3228714 RepID=UPI0038C0FC13
MSQELPKKANSRSASNFLLGSAALVILLAGLKAATPILLPFLLALFIAIIANPFVVYLTRWRIPRIVAVLLILLLIVVAILLIAGVVGSSISSFKASIPQYRTQLLANLGILTQLAAYLDIQISREMISSYFDPGVVFGVFANTLSGLSSMATDLFIILLTTVFMLLEADSLPRKLYTILQNPRIGLSQINRFTQSVNHYMGVKTLVSLMTAVPITLVLLWMKVDYAVLWGLLAFLLNFIPNVGSLLAAIPSVLLALVQLGVSSALGVAGTYVVVNLVVGNVIEPRLMGRGLGLSSLVVILSLVFWGWLFGSVGMLLSVPLTMIVKIGLESHPEGHWFAKLLSHPDEIQPHDH